MGVLSKLAGIVIGPGLLVGVAGVLYAAVELWAQSRCHQWLECLQESQLIVFIAALVIGCSGIGFVVVSLSQLATVRSLTLAGLGALVCVLALLQVAMVFGLGLVSFGEPDAVMAVLIGWAAVSGSVCWLVLAGVRRLAPNNSSKPTPLRGAA